jgi:hypothetical protein
MNQGDRSAGPGQAELDAMLKTTGELRQHFRALLEANLFGHELRTRGFDTNTELFVGLKAGRGLSTLEQVHGRTVLDFLDELWCDAAFRSSGSG